jgi:hypothetical protein
MKAPIGIISEVEQIEEAKVNNRKKKTELTEDGVKKEKEADLSTALLDILL